MEASGIYNYVVIEGNIGAGKTSFCNKIANEYNAKFIPEQFEENPFLPKFYKEPSRYAFQLEMTFLADRYQQLISNLPSQDLFKSFTISDYFIFKSLIFARNTLAADEYKLYSRFFKLVSDSIPKPGIIIYLHKNIENLLVNIKQRGRDYEQQIQKSYLEKLQSTYLDYFKQINDIPVLIVDSNNIDFVNDNMHYEKLKLMIFKEYSPGMHMMNL